MAAAAVKVEPRSAQGEPKGVQRTPKGARREPEGARREPKGRQKGAQGRPKCIQISMSENYPKKGALFPVLRHILGVILGAKLHQKRI